MDASMADLQIFLAHMRCREVQIFSIIDSIDARISRICGIVGADTAIDAMIDKIRRDRTQVEVVGGAEVIDGGDPIVEAGLGDGTVPVGVGDDVQLGVTLLEDTTAEVEAEDATPEVVAVAEDVTPEVEAEDVKPEMVDGGEGFHTDVVGLGNGGGMIGVGDGVQLDVAPVEADDTAPEEVAGRAGIVGGVDAVRSGDGSGPVGVGDDIQTPAKEEEAEDFTPPDVAGLVNDVGVVGLGDGSGPVGAEDGVDVTQVEEEENPEAVAGRAGIVDGGLRLHTSVAGLGDGSSSSFIVGGGNGAGATGLGNTGDPIGVGDQIQLDVTPAEEVELDVTSADEVEGETMKAEEVVVEKKTSEEFGGEKLTAEEVTGSAAVIGGGNGAGATGLGDTGDPIGVKDQIQLDVTPAEGVTRRAIVDRSNETGLGDGGGSVQIGDELRLNVSVTPAGGDGENVSSEDVTDAGNGVGTVGVDGAGDQSLLDRRVRKSSTVTRAVAHRICSNFCLMIVLFVVGAVCSFISPFFLTMDAFSRLCYGALAAVSFLLVSIIGYNFRDCNFLRATPKLSVRLMFIILSSILINIVANLIETSDQYYYAFTSIGLAVFCLVELAQPTCDYGLMQFFVCLPLQIAIPLHGLAFHWSYIPACIIPLFCLPTQLYFIEYFDEDYQKPKKSTNPLEAPLLGGDHMV